MNRIMDIEDCATKQDAVCFVHLHNNGVTFSDYKQFDVYWYQDLNENCGNCQYFNDCPLAKYYESQQVSIKYLCMIRRRCSGDTSR